jgi:Secretion system C-terminal sorting domain/Thermolysin metallopeptidase, catalytic domain
LDIHPTISINQAIESAKNSFGSENEKIDQSGQLVIYPVTLSKETTFLLCWLISLKSDNGVNSYSYLINAYNGSVISTINNNRDDFGGHISGSHWPLYPTDSPVNTSFPNSKAKLLNVISMDLIGTSTANNNGDYTMVAGPLGPYFIMFLLADDYCQIYDDIGESNPTMELRKITGLYTQNKNWDISEQSNLKWHMRNVHDFYKNTFGYNGVDFVMEGHTNAGSATNGRATGNSIFFGTNLGYNWVRCADVIYHEYTHNVIYHIYGNFIGTAINDQASAMDEGLADFFACDMTNDPLINEGIATSVARNLSNNLIWDPAIEFHIMGQVIGGACWNLRQAIGSSITEQLVFKALQLSPKARNYQDFLYNLLICDNNIYAGIYHNAILNAFNIHGIIYPVLSSLISGPTSLNINQSGTWSASPSGGLSPFHYQWYYLQPSNSPQIKLNGIKPNHLQFGIWYATGSNSSILTRYDNINFELKCVVTDATNTQITSNILSVSVGGNNNDLMSQEKYISVYDEKIPEEYSIGNFHNPFNPTTTINYQLPFDSFVNIKVFNMLGKEVSTLVNGYKLAGKYGAKFDASNLASGIYIYTIRANNFIKSNKMLLIK